MINRRTYRPSGSVEKLQQLSLNSSEGVSCIRPHNDTKSVYDAKNLIINQDGSLSLRKPLILRAGFDTAITKVIPLFNEYCIAVTSSGFKVLHSGTPVDFKVVWSDYAKNFHTVILGPNRSAEEIGSSKLDLTHCYSTQTGTSVVLSNCLIKPDLLKFDGEPYSSGESENFYTVFDVSLLESTSLIEGKFPILVGVILDNADNTVVITADIPLPNEYRFDSNNADISDREVRLPNPFAFRDTYGESANIKTIRQYVPTALENGIIVNDSDTHLGQSQSFQNNIEFGVGDTVLLTDVSSSTAGAMTTSTANFSQTHEHTVYYDTDGVTVAHSEDAAFSLVYRLTLKGTVTFQESTSYFDYHTLNVLFTEAVYTVQYRNFDGHLRTLNIPPRQFHIRGGSFTRKNNNSSIKAIVTSAHIGGYVRTAVSSTNAELTYDLKDNLNNTIGTQDYYDSLTFTTLKTQLTNNNLCIGFGFSDTGLEDYAVQKEVATVKDLTESAKSTRYRATDYLNTTLMHSILKAFISVPNSPNDLYIAWDYTFDGTSWNTALLYQNIPPERITVVQNDSAEPLKDVKATASTINRYYAKLSTGSSLSQDDPILWRADCLLLDNIPQDILSKIVAFRCILANINVSNDNYYNNLYRLGTLRATYGLKDILVVNVLSEFEEYDLSNPALSKLKYINTRMYDYESSRPYVRYTYPGELTFPLNNAMAYMSKSDKTVTTILRWRDYIVGATESALYLSNQVENGFITKTINTSIGIPEQDEACAVAILNGIIFKSGTKVYQLYPNIYSGDVTNLNVTDISLPIAHHIENWTPNQNISPFAFSTESEYVLMLPESEKTQCLRYNYTTRVWTRNVYDVVFYDFRIENLEDIRLWGVKDSCICEYLFDADFVELPFESMRENVPDLPYGDVLSIEKSGTFTQTDVIDALTTYLTSGPINECIEPIEFELDTGQKADTILTTKQFVESKLMFATVDKNDSFPMQLTIHIDGDPHIVTTDISTDASFWKNENDGGALNTTFTGLSSSSESFNTLRQLIVRYSGKGKSIRHILTGESLCNFKLYETYIRYKPLNVKQ